MRNELYHYGIPGMKWGVRRYQPNKSNSSSKRQTKQKRKMSNKKKVALGIAAVAALGIGAYSVYKISKSNYNKFDLAGKDASSKAMKWYSEAMFAPVNSLTGEMNEYAKDFQAKGDFFKSIADQNYAMRDSTLYGRFHKKGYMDD